MSVVYCESSLDYSPLPISLIEHFPFTDKPTFELVSSELDAIVRNNNLKSIPTFCVLSRELYRLILIDIPDNIPKNELSEASKWIIKDLIDFPIDDLASDVFLLPKIEDQHSKGYVCIAKKHMLKIRQQQIISAEMDLIDMTINDLTLTYLTKNSMENCLTVIVSLSTSHSSLLLCMNQQLCLKHNIDLTINSSNNSLDPTLLTQLPNEIEKLISYYMSTLSQKPSIQILLLPQQKITNIVEDTIQSALPYPIKVLDINELFMVPTSLSPNIIEHSLPALGSLLVQG